MQPYAYPTTNSDLVKSLQLLTHPEGGYFAETVAVSQSSEPLDLCGLSNAAGDSLEHKAQHATGSGTSWFGGGATPEERPTMTATQIYYLLTAESHLGRMHLNLHGHFTLLHQGRSVYTLIQPPKTPGDKPKVVRIVMGADIANGEVMQLYVPGGWWKASEIPEADLGGDKERIGCLVSEIVVPGWTPAQNVFLDEDTLKGMWGGEDDWKDFQKYVHSS